MREAKIAEEGGLSNNVVPYFGKQGRERLFFCTELHGLRFYAYFCAESIGFLNLFIPSLLSLSHKDSLDATINRNQFLYLMKKLFTLFAMGAIVLSGNAQKTIQGSRFFDNWSIGLVGGAYTKTTHNAMFKNARAAYGLEVTKQITPIFGVGVQGTATNNITDSKNAIDAVNADLLAKFNLTNAIFGYKGEPRVFEVEGVYGIGLMHYFKVGDDGGNDMTSQAGLNFNFNLGKEKAWTVALKPAIVWNLDGGSKEQNTAYNVNHSAIQVLAGVTYHFKNKSNGKHYLTFAKGYDQAEVDGLNAKINDLRAQVSDKDAQVSKLNGQIRTLQQQLNDERNKKPAVQIQKVVETQKGANSLEQTITFRQGKSVIDASQLPNVERVATFMKNHKDAKVTIKGYASPEGSAEINAKIAKARAEAVKTVLVNKYKIDASRIVAEGQGVGDMFSEPDWNRVSICTIESK